MTHQEAVDTLAAERYQLDEMSALERDAFEEHYMSCVECAEDVRSGALMAEGARRLFGEQRAARTVAFTPRSAAPRAAPAAASRVRTFVPWAAAASLALVAGYQSFVVVPALQRASAPQAVAPVSLRPASRGEAAVVTVDPGGSVVLAIDLAGPDLAGTALAYAIADPQGRQTAAGRAAAPAAGVPLFLVVPGRALSVHGTYTVTVQDADRTGGAVAEYRFTTAP